MANGKQTKAEMRAELMREMGRGRQMITSAEWSYGMDRSITLDQLIAQRTEGNNIIAGVLDRADVLNIRIACY